MVAVGFEPVSALNAKLIKPHALSLSYPITKYMQGTFNSIYLMDVII